jgi:hypothetical protein
MLAKVAQVKTNVGKYLSLAAVARQLMIQGFELDHLRDVP